MHLLQLFELVFAADEGRELSRQIREGASHRPDRREFLWRIEIDQLKHVLGTSQVFQLMQTQIPERRPGRQLVDEELLGGL